MPPAASAAVPIGTRARPGPGPRSRPWSGSTAGAASKVMMLIRTGQVQIKLPGDVQAPGPRFGQDMARPDSVTAGTTRMPAAWAATTYQARGRTAASRRSRSRPGRRRGRGPSGRPRRRPPPSRPPCRPPAGGSQRSQASRWPVASRVPAATELGRNGPGTGRGRCSDVDRARLDLGLAEPAELLRDRPAGQAELAGQLSVQFGR